MMPPGMRRRGRRCCRRRPTSTDQSEVALISIEGVNFEALPKIDADVAFQGQAVEHGEFRFDQLSFDLKLRDQVAVLDAAGEGQYRDDPLSLEAHLGNEETLENPDARYPIDVQIASEEHAGDGRGYGGAGRTVGRARGRCGLERAEPRPRGRDPPASPADHAAVRAAEPSRARRRTAGCSPT